MTGPQQDYSSLVAEAEEAVQSVKDPELRRIAFQRVLEELLGGGRRKGGHNRQKQPRKKANRGAPKSGRGGPNAFLREMHEEGFFQKPKTITAVKVELENRGHHIPMTSLSGPLQRLCKVKVLRRQKTEGKGKKKPFGYSNW